MFGSKRIKELENEVSKLKDKIKGFPDIRVCPECEDVKAKHKFAKPWSSTRHLWIGSEDESHFYNEHCSDCNSKIEERERAVSMAKSDPKKVIKCCTKKK